MKKISILVCLATLTSLFAVGCTEKGDNNGVKLEMTPVEVSLKIGESVKLEIKPIVEGNSYTSEDTKVATVDPRSGNITAVGVGKTKVTAKNTKYNFTGECDVTVDYRYAYFLEPYLNFGCTADEVKANETRELDSEYSADVSWLFYKGKGAFVSHVIYQFADSKQILGGILFPMSDDNYGDVKNFLEERYSVVKEGEDATGKFTHYKSQDGEYDIWLEELYASDGWFDGINSAFEGCPIDKDSDFIGVSYFVYDNSKTPLNLRGSKKDS